MSKVLEPLDLQYVDGKTWILLTPFSVQSDVLGGTLRVQAGFVTDFNSVPLGLWNLLPPVCFGEAAVAHDKLYQEGTWLGLPIDRGTADRVHREFVIWKGAPGWKVRAYYFGLRLFGWATWQKYRRADVPSAV